MAMPYSFRINSRTAARDHSGAAIPRSAGLFSSRRCWMWAACSSLRVRPEPTGRPVRSPGSPPSPAAWYADHHRDTVSRATPSMAATSLSLNPSSQARKARSRNASRTSSDNCLASGSVMALTTPPSPLPPCLCFSPSSVSKFHASVIGAAALAFALAEGTAVEVQPFEVQHPLAEVAMPALVHPDHAVDALH